MSSKTPKVTLKTLQIEMDILRNEIKSVRSELKEVKEELDEVKNEKINEKVSDQIKETERVNSAEDLKHKICKICRKNFESKRKLLKHVKEEHPKTIACKSCEEIFHKNSDLEVHIEAEHKQMETYDCDRCDKKFVLIWRLRKHKESHTNMNMKKCHYFNNKKVCPYEKIGCMFDHSTSEICIFGGKCTNKLCPYQHEKEVDEPIETLEKDLKDKFDNLSYDEQYESKMIICDKLCKASHGYHRCNDDDYEGYVGCDAFNITDEFDEDCNKTELFPCEECDDVFEEYLKVREHFLKQHKRYEMIGCIEKSCDYTVKSVEMLIKHIGVKHYDIVKQRL